MSAATANPPVVSHRSRRQLARIWRDLSGVSKVSVIILIVVILMATIGPILVRTDPNAINLSEAFGAPS